MPPLIYPIAFYVLYIFALFLAVAFVRVRGVKSGAVPLEYFATYEGRGPPEWMVVLGRHYDNQFQVPVLFLVSCVAALHISAGRDILVLSLSWSFIASRLLHTTVHLGGNNIVHRLTTYALGWLLLMALWLRLLLLN